MNLLHRTRVLNIKIMNLFGKINYKLSWIFEDLIWIVLKPLLHKARYHSDITIGITTFMDRYDNCLKPLVKKMVALFPENQIIVIVNGHVKKKEQAEYLNAIESFCRKLPNVELISYEDPKGLSFLWNTLVKHAKTENVLILNDDVKIKYSFPKWIAQSDIQHSDMAIINGSWSHFIISKSIIASVGWFDEGLLEIGGEDDDYAARLAVSKIKTADLKTSAIAGRLKAKQKRLTVNSYGKNMNDESHGYSTCNNRYLAEKWDMRNEPFEGAIEVSGRLMRYWKKMSSF